MDEKQILVSLGDERVREIGEVIGNKSCNKILDFFAEEDGTVSDIAQRLNMPMNTVDYNVKKLLRAGLIEKSSHWWSVKGKKMPIYKISNRKIVISPRKSVTKVFAWVIGLTGLTALTIREFIQSSNAIYVTKGGFIQEAFSNGAALKMENDLMNIGASTVSSSGFWGSLASWEWFLIGAWFAVLLFFLVTIINERRLGKT